MVINNALMQKKLSIHLLRWKWLILALLYKKLIMSLNYIVISFKKPVSYIGIKWKYVIYIDHKIPFIEM